MHSKWSLIPEVVKLSRKNFIILITLSFKIITFNCNSI